jgi:hypothetical protein
MAMRVGVIGSSIDDDMGVIRQIGLGLASLAVKQWLP